MICISVEYLESIGSLIKVCQGLISCSQAENQSDDEPEMIDGDEVDDLHFNNGKDKEEEDDYEQFMKEKAEARA